MNPKEFLSRWKEGFNMKKTKEIYLWRSLKRIINGFIELLQYKPFWRKVWCYSNEIALVGIGLAYFIIIWKARWIINLPFELKLGTELMQFSINPIFLTVNIGFLIMIGVLLFRKFQIKKDLEEEKKK